MSGGPLFCLAAVLTATSADGCRTEWVVSVVGLGGGLGQGAEGMAEKVDGLVLEAEANTVAVTPMCARPNSSLMTTSSTPCSRRSVAVEVPQSWNLPPAGGSGGARR